MEKENQPVEEETEKVVDLPCPECGTRMWVSGHCATCPECGFSLCSM